MMRLAYSGYRGYQGYPFAASGRATSQSPTSGVNPVIIAKVGPGVQRRSLLFDHKPSS
ncbi:hypothetical protein BJY04DRAFT_181287 [Aspergillus karnatakaensis]|uniref:uncharacterized protein n=1 Tax=Aspergillus karnatakaensis TaxID=1810916 RepID=UPI003CCDCDB5